MSIRIKNHEQKVEKRVKRKLEQAGLPPNIDAFKELVHLRPIAYLCNDRRRFEHTDTPTKLEKICRRDYRSNLESYLEEYRRKVEGNEHRVAEVKNDDATGGDQLDLL